MGEFTITAVRLLVATLGILMILQAITNFGKKKWYIFTVGIFSLLMSAALFLLPDLATKAVDEVAAIILPILWLVSGIYYIIKFAYSFKLKQKSNS